MSRVMQARDHPDEEALSSTLCPRCQTLDFPSADVKQPPGEDIFHFTADPLKLDTACSLCNIFQTICRRHGNQTLLHECLVQGVWFRHPYDVTPSPSIQISTVDKKKPFGLLLAAGSDCNERLSARLLASSSVDYEYLSSWLKICDGEHDCGCFKNGTTTLSDQGIDSHSFKLIDCSSKRLVSASDLEPDGAAYVTLSYLWGSNAAVSMGSSGLLPPDVPRVIQDAMTVVLRLSFRYLWVDRYCIPQHDPVAKAGQIARMGEIYAASSLTIIAAAGSGPDHGLPGVSTLRIPQKYVRTEKYHWVDVPFLVDDIEASQWNSRGWTYQEGLLSRRRLIFSDWTVYLQCTRMYAYEELSKPLSSGIESVSNTLGVLGEGCAKILRPIFPPAEPAPNDFLNKIQRFYRKELSVQADALDAMAGILSLFKSLGIFYIMRHSCLSIRISAIASQRYHQSKHARLGTGLADPGTC